MKSFVQAVQFLCSFAILGINSTAYSAPSIPDGGKRKCGDRSALR